MDPTTQLQRTVEQAAKIVDGVRDEQLADPTPCTDWDVRALLGHLSGGALMFSAAARNGSVPDEVMVTIRDPEFVGGDFRQQFRSEGTAIVEAFEDPAVLETNIVLPFGTMPAPMVRDLVSLDLAVHAADLAHATGQPFDDDELAEASIDLARQMEKSMGAAFRSPGVYGPEQSAPEAATTAQRLLAFTGRAVD